MKQTSNWAIIIMIFALTTKTAPALAQLNDPCEKAFNCPQVKEAMSKRYRNYWVEFWLPKRPRYGKQSGGGTNTLKEKHTSKFTENGVNVTETTYENTDSVKYTNQYEDGSTESFWIIPPDGDTSWILRRTMPPATDSTQFGTPPVFDSTSSSNDTAQADTCREYRVFFKTLPEKKVQEKGTKKYRQNFVQNTEYNRTAIMAKQSPTDKELVIRTLFEKNPGLARIIVSNNTKDFSKNGVTFIGCSSKTGKTLKEMLAMSLLEEMMWGFTGG